MTYIKKHWAAVGLMLVAGLLFVGSLLVVAPASQMPAQAAVITPVAQTGRVGKSRVAEFFKARSITEDTRACFDLADYEIVDLQYNIDQGTQNTVTLSIQQSNDNLTFNAANSIVAANDADANAMLQFPLFGRYNCVLADVTNSNALSLTVIGVAK